MRSKRLNGYARSGMSKREALKGKSSEQRRAFYRDRARRLHERLGVSKENRQNA